MPGAINIIPFKQATQRHMNIARNIHLSDVVRRRAKRAFMRNMHLIDKYYEKRVQLMIQKSFWRHKKISSVDVLERDCGDDTVRRSCGKIAAAYRWCVFTNHGRSSKLLDALSRRWFAK